MVLLCNNQSLRHRNPPSELRIRHCRYILDSTHNLLQQDFRSSTEVHLVHPNLAYRIDHGQVHKVHHHIHYQLGKDSVHWMGNSTVPAIGLEGGWAPHWAFHSMQYHPRSLPNLIRFLRRYRTYRRFWRMRSFQREIHSYQPVASDLFPPRHLKGLPEGTFFRQMGHIQVQIRKVDLQVDNQASMRSCSATLCS